jgi:hypothetical protein
MQWSFATFISSIGLLAGQKSWPVLPENLHCPIDSKVIGKYVYKLYN